MSNINNNNSKAKPPRIQDYENRVNESRAVSPKSVLSDGRDRPLSPSAGSNKDQSRLIDMMDEHHSQEVALVGAKVRRES